MGTAARRRSGSWSGRRERERARAAIDVREAGFSDAATQELRQRRRDVKGKRRAYAAQPSRLLRRDDDGEFDGDGGDGGVVLDMTLVGDETWDP